MPGKGVGGFVRGLIDPPDAGLADRDLLHAYRADGDEAAFARLVRRHDRLVRAAVGRVLADPADRADARQAAWLVLVRRAGSVRWRAGLGPWLYGVAHRVAVRLRARSQRSPGPLAADPPDPARPPDPSWREACDLLHAELDRLPDRYRLPLLLCYLEGHTRDTAAAELGVSVGAVKGRVRRGLDRLRRRLEARGVSLSAGLLAAVAAPQRTAAGPVVVGRAVPPRVERLVKEVAVGASGWKWLAGLVAGAVAGGIGIGVGLASDPARVPRPDVRPAVAVAAPAKPWRPNVFLFSGPGGYVLLDAAGKQVEQLDQRLHCPQFSPDGRWVAAFDREKDGPNGQMLIVPRVAGEEPHEVPLAERGPLPPGGVGFGVSWAVWAPDSKRLVVCETGNQVQGSGCHVYDLRTRDRAEFRPPARGQFHGWINPDTALVMTSFDLKLGGSATRLERVPLAGDRPPVPLTPDDLTVWGGWLSPDGKRLLYRAAPAAAEVDPTTLSLYTATLDLGSSAAPKPVRVEGPGAITGACWSPDGKRVAYTLQRPVPDPEATAEREVVLYTAGADGRSKEEVTRRKTTVVPGGDGRLPAVVYHIHVLGWR